MLDGEVLAWKNGRVMPFEEEAVQDRIRGTLRKEQFGALREKVQTKLEEDATIRLDSEIKFGAANGARGNGSPKLNFRTPFASSSARKPTRAAGAICRCRSTRTSR